MNTLTVEELFPAMAVEVLDRPDVEAALDPYLPL